MIGGFYVWPSVYRVGCGESTRVIGKFATYFFLQIGQISIWRVKSNNSVRYALSLSLAAWLAKERKKKRKNRVNSLCDKGEWAKSGPNLAQVSVELFWVGWTSAWLGPTAASE